MPDGEIVRPFFIINDEKNGISGVMGLYIMRTAVEQVPRMMGSNVASLRMDA